MRYSYLLLIPAVALWSTPTAVGQTSSTGLAPGTAAAGSGFCADYMADQANSAACIQASTTPTAGLLLPLGQDSTSAPPVRWASAR